MAYLFMRTRWQNLDLGRMEVQCMHCAAYHWLTERVGTSSNRNPQFTTCCKQGDVVLKPLIPPPPTLRALFEGTDIVAKHFKQHIRKYNSALAFTSIKYQADERLMAAANGIKCFQIHGELFHLQGPLQPAANELPQFAQLYFYDSEYATSIRGQRYGGQLSLTTLRELIDCLTVVNPFIHIYRTARERLAECQQDTEAVRILLNPQLCLIMESGADKRRENLPTSNEVALIIADEYNKAGCRDIVLARRSVEGDAQFTSINPNHAAYMPLHYVLLFPHGDLGWHWALQLRNEAGKRKQLRLPQRAFYRYRLHVRHNDFPTLFHAQRLFQQYIVDAWAVCDQNALVWLQNNQRNLRADLYNGLADTLLHTDGNLENLGRRMILPSSYTGGDRFMQQLFQDSMAIVRHFGRPTLFITFTANPKWKEIVQELLPGQSAIDRPDLVARVFHLKQKELLDEIKHKNIFGRFLGCVWTIEYQKRGLPHMHLLLFLHSEDRFLTATHINEIISAEIPTEEVDPEGTLRNVITTCMMHGPCGHLVPHAPCMIAKTPGGPKTCSKHYPRAFQEETLLQEDGYPLYRRQDNGSRISYPLRRGNEVIDFAFDNTWVVPYNPYLSWRYKAHINVEVCASVQAVKYIHKYIYKGSDRTTLHIETDQNEIQQYLQGRYISPPEAIWRLFEFPIHEEWPPVIHLAIHLPGEQPVYFAADASEEAIRNQMDRSATTLMAFFQYNTEHSDGQQYLYQEFPCHYTYSLVTRKWSKRQRGTAIGRIYHCNPFMGEKYYLRLLLTVVRGPTSFTALRTIHGVLYPTFLLACKALGLLEDDNEWLQCFTEAATFRTGQSLRNLFGTALVFGNVTEPLVL